MKELNLEKLWEVCNMLSDKMGELSEENLYVYLLGFRSCYGASDFENFLSYYSFKIEDGGVNVYNDDGIPYESYTNNDYSFIPFCLLSFSRENIEKWIDDEIEKQLKQQELQKIQEKDNIRLRIKILEKQLNS
jgi:hypothetical protein